MELCVMEAGVTKSRELRAILGLLTAFGGACASEPSEMNDALTVGGANAPTAGSAGVNASAMAGAIASGGVSAAPSGMAGASAAGTNAMATGGVGGAGAAGAVTGGVDGAGTGAGGMAGAGGTGGTEEPMGPGFPQLPRVDSTDGPGPFTAVTKVKNTPPGGWLIYPTELGEGGMKHPIFLFGPGGGTTPDTYETSGMHWDRYASYGFVIYVLPRSTGDGAAMKAGLDWVIEQNADASSPLFEKLDTSKVCAAGHSQGSVTTFDFMPDERVTTTIHISGGSLDMMGPSHLTSDTMFMCAPDSSNDPAKPQCDSDFALSNVPTFYTVVQGSDHLTSARLGWSATIAWLLWHLAGQEDQWRSEFLEPGGRFQSGIFESQIKNW
jgi:hypothetical protein